MAMEPGTFLDRFPTRNRELQYQRVWLDYSHYIAMIFIWRFPEMGVPPVIIHLEKYHPAIGVPTCMETAV